MNDLASAGPLRTGLATSAGLFIGIVVSSPLFDRPPVEALAVGSLASLLALAVFVSLALRAGPKNKA